MGSHATVSIASSASSVLHHLKQLPHLNIQVPTQLVDYIQLHPCCGFIVQPMQSIPVDTCVTGHFSNFLLPLAQDSRKVAFDHKASLWCKKTCSSEKVLAIGFVCAKFSPVGHLILLKRKKRGKHYGTYLSDY